MAMTTFETLDDQRAIDCHHLSSAGAYQTQTQKLRKKYPNLVHADWKVPYPVRDTHKVRGRLKLLDLSSTPVAPKELTPEQLKRELTSTQPGQQANNVARRLYLLEAVDPDFVAVLGEHFRLNPTIFMRHQRTALWENDHKQGNTPFLASHQDASKSFIMEFCEIRYFHRTFETGSARNPLDHRHIGVAKLDGVYQKVGLLHQKASFWCRKSTSGGWDGEEHYPIDSLGLTFSSHTYSRSAASQERRHITW